MTPSNSINSVFEQSDQPLEFIILDDCSTDDDLGVIESLADKHTIIKIVCNEQNSGVVYSMNRLLEMPKGNYIYGAASDDMILLGLIGETMELLGKRPETALCSTISLLLRRTLDRFVSFLTYQPSKFKSALRSG